MAARCVRCGGELGFSFSTVCAPCRKGEKNETANPLWVPGGDGPDALRAAVESIPGDPIWYRLLDRAHKDAEFAVRAGRAAAPMFEECCRVDQLHRIAHLLPEIWQHTRELPEVKAAIQAAEARAQVEQRLLDAIAAAPGDDEPRLVYADWLLEQPTAEERARGERVHAEVLLATMPDGDPRAAEITARLRELWVTPAGARWRLRAHGTLSHRGVPLYETNESWLGDEAPSDPWLLGARVEEPTSEMWHVAQHKLQKAPHLARFIALDLSDLDGDEAGAILASPHLGKLAFLRIPMHDDAIAALPESLPHLIELELVHGRAVDLAAIFRRGLPRLRRVIVCGPNRPPLVGWPIEVAHRPDAASTRARLID